MSVGNGRLWTYDEAGAYLGLSRSTVERLTRPLADGGPGPLVKVRNGGRVFVEAASVLAMLDGIVEAAHTPPGGIRAVAPRGGTIADLEAAPE